MNFEKIKIRSRRPMYTINDNGEILEITNVYDSEEIIEVFINNIGHSIKIPINKRITIIPKLGLVLFRTKEDAMIFGRMLNSNFDSIEKTSNSQSKIKENIVVLDSKKPVKNGLYSIDSVDKAITGVKNDYWYVTKDNKIESVKVIDIEKSPESEIILEYLNRNSAVDNVNVSNNKVIYEILYTNGKAYITHYVINVHTFNTKVEFITDLNNYKIFRSKQYAKDYLFKSKLTGNKNSYINESKYEYDSYDKYNYRKQVKKETTKKIFNIIWGIVWNHKEVILDKGLGFVKDIVKNAKVAKEVAGEMEKMLTDMIENGEVAVAG